MASSHLRVVDIACSSAVRQISAISPPTSMARLMATAGVESRRSSSRVFCSGFLSSGTVKMARRTNSLLKGSKIAVVVRLNTVWITAMLKALACS